MLNIEKIKKGSELKKLRQALDLSQEKFGGIIGYTLNRISLIERTDMELPDKVKKALNRSIKSLEKHIK